MSGTDPSDAFRNPGWDGRAGDPVEPPPAPPSPPAQEKAVWLVVAAVVAGFLGVLGILAFLADDGGAPEAVASDRDTTTTSSSVTTSTSTTSSTSTSTTSTSTTSTPTTTAPPAELPDLPTISGPTIHSGDLPMDQLLEAEGRALERRGTGTVDQAAVVGLGGRAVGRCVLSLASGTGYILAYVIDTGQEVVVITYARATTETLPDAVFDASVATFSAG